MGSLSGALLFLILFGGQDSRLKVPEESAQKEALELIRDIYKEEYADSSLTGRRKLAGKLRKQADADGQDEATRYVLLREARDQSVEAGDVKEALKLQSKLAFLFEIDEAKEKRALLETAALRVRTPSDVATVAGEFLALAETSARNEKFQFAAEVAGKAMSVAKRARNMPLVTRARALQKKIKEDEKAVGKILDLMKKLESRPKDASANLEVGLYLAVRKSDWKAALPYLSKVRDKSLSALAERDLKGAEGPNDRLSLGDGWWELAETEKDEERQRAYRIRAGYWYRHVLPDISGLQALKVKKRLDAAPFDPSLLVPDGPWWRIEDPSLFGLSGEAGKPLKVTGSQNDATVVKLLPFPPGDYDGVSVRVRLPEQGAVQAFVVFAPREYAVYVERKVSQSLAVADLRGETPRNRKVARFPSGPEIVFEILVEDGIYVVKANGEEFKRVSSGETKIKGLWLQASWNTVEFDQIRLHRRP